MNCEAESFDKKLFGIAVYEKLRELYGAMDDYEVSQIKNTVEILGYPDSLTCWALVAFMLPANAVEYFRSQGTPLNILEMKRALILAMTDGEKSSLTLPRVHLDEYDIEVSQLSHFLTHRSLANYFSARAGYHLGTEIASMFA